MPTAPSQKSPWQNLFAGLKDSVQFPIAFFVLYGSERLSKSFVKSAATSLILGFSFWIFLVYFAWSTTGQISSIWILITGLYSKPPLQLQTPSSFSSFILSTWSKPNTSLSSSIFMYSTFLINNSLFAQLSKRSFEIFTGTAPQIKKQSIGRAIKQLYKNIFYASVFACILALSLLLPSGSSPILVFFNFTSWILRLILHSYFMILLTFELKGSNRGWEFDQSLAYIQVNWIYFAGFAAIPSFIGFVLFDVLLGHSGQIWKLVKLGLLSIIFPLYIVMSCRSHPPPQKSLPSPPSTHFLPHRLPIFYIPEQLANLMIRILKPT